MSQGSDGGRDRGKTEGTAHLSRSFGLGSMSSVHAVRMRNLDSRSSLASRQVAREGLCFDNQTEGARRSPR